MFTSRAEYRLLLREDNADLRLLEKGCELGLHDQNTLEDLKKKRRGITEELKRLDRVRVKPSGRVTSLLKSRGSSAIETPIPLSHLLKRPELGYGDIAALENQPSRLSPDVQRQVEIQCKYEGYLKRQEGEVKKFRHLEGIEIPEDFNYNQVPGLSNEIRQKLTEIQPVSLGQASRISGITPAALSVLMVFLKRHRGENRVSP
jgi:tRNA uridine 5-carboxymethylaminomethyl modification enzyme